MWLIARYALFSGVCERMHNILPSSHFPPTHPSIHTHKHTHAVPSTAPEVLAAHDITTIIESSANATDGFKFPLTVIRSYERTTDGAGLVIRFNLTNTGTVAVEIGGLGFAMPEAPGNPPKGIETTVIFFIYKLFTLSNV